MEKQLFDWAGWDQADTAAFTFYKVKLKVQIGRHKPGKKFSMAFVDYEKGILELYATVDTTIAEEFKLALTLLTN